MEIWIGLAMFAALLASLTIGMPVAFAMIAAAIGSLAILGDGIDALGLVASTLWSAVTDFTLTALPLFILMGAIVSNGGMGRRMYTALSAILHGVPGGLAVATTLACTIMAATSGSSVATAASVGGFSIREMRRFGYRDSDACGAVAAGGTLGILIPPSIPFIVYGVIAEQSIGKLFIAGIIPGLIMSMSFMVFQVILAMRRNAQAPSAKSERRVSVRERVVALGDLVPMALMILVILGSIYAGIATPTEAAALGVVASLLISGVIYRELTWTKIAHILQETAQSIVMVMMIVAGAMLFGYAMTTTNVAPTLSRTVAELHVAPWVLFISINLLLILLGFFLEPVPIIVVIMPILIPIISAFGWDMIWFGVILVINMEMALIHPPVGLNLFVVQGVAPDVKLVRIMLGALPYVIIMACVLALVAVFPGLATFLPARIR